ncbi:S-adenosyl-L-methionine-dependent methyltransferase [Serendipita vermifera]|nr:S-adenosyl-L-methionine-dependent methyltransferase [Serendipita vermifera]
MTDNKSNVYNDDASSRASVTTYTSNADHERLTVHVAGRTINSLSELYQLPTDLDEWNRLISRVLRDKQHVALSMGLGSLYPDPEVVEAVLAPGDGPRKLVADIGCGTGIWALEMAKNFPHCDILGIDLASVPIPPENLPSNCRFEVDNITLGLNHLHGQLDVAFLRAISMGIKDARKTFNDVAQCLKPGGVVIWIEGDYDFYSGFPIVYKPFGSEENPSGSYLQRMGYELRRAVTANGGALKEVERLMDQGLWWQSDMIDPDTCKTASLLLPIGTWLEGNDETETQKLRWIGTLMRQDMMSGLRGAHPVLLRAGWSQDTLDRWTAKLDEECTKGTYGLRFRFAWGRRREGPNSPAPALPKLQLTNSLNKTPLFIYEVYNTSQEAQEKIALRNRGKDIPPPPPPGNT